MQNKPIELNNMKWISEIGTQKYVLSQYSSKLYSKQIGCSENFPK